MFVTETSANGAGAGSKTAAAHDDVKEMRIQWMDQTFEACMEVRKDGIPLLGYTWFPLFTMVDWKYRMEPGTVEDYFVNFGMIEVENGTFNRKWTPVADRFLEHMRDFETEGAASSVEAA